MDWDLKITDLEGSTPEHSAVIVNFLLQRSGTS